MVYLPREGADLGADELRSFLENRLAKFKVPQYLWKAEEMLPRLGTQKIDRKTLRAEYNAKVAGDAA